MFYEGSLQEGISAAVGQQKLVFCFVTNENDESNSWENEFLQDASVKDIIAKQAVALRLIAGSEEAGYLAQIFPLPQTPTIVIMKHGELKEYIAAGATKEDFLRRVQSSFNISPPPAPPSTEPRSHSPPVNSSATTIPPTVERSDNVRRVLEERAAKLRAEKEAAEQKAKEVRKQKSKADREAAQGAHKQAELAKKRKQQEAEERRRILKRIQDDKEERRQQAAEREQQRMVNQSSSDSSSSATAAPQGILPSVKGGEYTSIQVRLFDGSTIRSRFKTKAAIEEVRKWVDANRTDGDLPYYFKQLLTPLPNKAIDETEEGKSLGEVGLVPSSTLILVPIHSFTSAYSGTSRGVLSRIVEALLGLFMWIMGLFGFGRGETSTQQAGSSEQVDGPSTVSHVRKSRPKGPQNPYDQRRDHQLYNGNSLNFEPIPDEDEK